jgi:tetratricopeptide (TPR) repeat protein
VALTVSAALLLCAVFAGDSAWTALAALLVAGVWGVLALTGRAPVPGGGLVLGGLLLATAAWSGLSIAWSVAPDLSWAELNRTLVYTAFLAVGLLLGAWPGSARLAGAALTVAFGVGVVWALAGKAIPAVFPDGGRAARLRDPIGYWNALALGADALLVLALSFAASARTVAVRAGGAALGYAAVVAVLLAASRAGVVAAVLGIVLWLWLRRDRVEAALLVLVATVPAAAVAGWAFTRPALVEDGASRADRVADGAWFGLFLLAGAALVALGARELGRRPLAPAARRRVALLLRGLAIGVALVTVVVLAANAGRIADEFRGEEVANDPGRFASLSSNNRLGWWGEARNVFEADPLTGAGANTFEVARKRYREIASSVTQPHSVPLQFLAGTGLVGLALLLGLVAAGAAAAVKAVRRLRGSERDAAAALAVALALWLVHALVDYPWDFVAVTGPALFATGALAAAGRPERRIRSPFAAVGVAAVALAGCASVVTPWLAERSVRDVNPALERGDLDAARDATERARSLDPLSLVPLFARARVEEAAGDEAAALAAYRRATDVQPENSVSWYELGLYEFSLGDRCSAYVHLNRSYTLDPAGLQWEPGGKLDQARAWVNQPGNC